MKIHPLLEHLFENLEAELEHGSVAEAPNRRKAFMDWREAGKPLMEEEPRAFPPWPPLFVEMDKAVYVNGWNAALDEAIKSLENRVLLHNPEASLRFVLRVIQGIKR